MKEMYDKVRGYGRKVLAAWMVAFLSGMAATAVIDPPCSLSSHVVRNDRQLVQIDYLDWEPPYSKEWTLSCAVPVALDQKWFRFELKFSSEQQLRRWQTGHRAPVIDPIGKERIA